MERNTRMAEDPLDATWSSASRLSAGLGSQPYVARSYADRHGDDRLREECGVFGILNHPDAAALTAIGMHALQHRGQEAAGIVTFEPPSGKRAAQFHSERRLGLVGDNFN